MNECSKGRTRASMNSEALCVGARVAVCACADQPAGAWVRAPVRVRVCAHRTDRTRVPGARPPSFLLPPPGGGRAPTLTPVSPEPRPASERPAYPLRSPPLIRTRGFRGSRVSGRRGARAEAPTSPRSAQSLHPTPTGPPVLAQPSPRVHGQSGELWG